MPRGATSLFLTLPLSSFPGLSAGSRDLMGGARMGEPRTIIFVRVSCLISTLQSKRAATSFLPAVRSLLFVGVCLCVCVRVCVCVHVCLSSFFESVSSVLSSFPSPGFLPVWLPVHLFFLSHG